MKASELIESKVFDQNAETVRELMTTWGCSYATAYTKAERLLREQKVEKVWKHGKDRPVPAYRVKKCR